MENPYKLIWFNFRMSQKQVDENNAKYWLWEMEHNGFIPANTRTSPPLPDKGE